MVLGQVFAFQASGALATPNCWEAGMVRRHTRRKGNRPASGNPSHVVTRAQLEAQRDETSTPEIEDLDPSRAGFVPRHLRPENQGKDWRDEVRNDATWVKRRE
jgi:hypothetical protein